MTTRAASSSDRLSGLPLPSSFAAVVEVRERATQYVAGMCVLLAATLDAALGDRPMEPAADPALGGYTTLIEFRFAVISRSFALEGERCSVVSLAVQTRHVCDDSSPKLRDRDTHQVQ